MYVYTYYIYRYIHIYIHSFPLFILSSCSSATLRIFGVRFRCTRPYTLGPQAKKAPENLSAQSCPAQVQLHVRFLTRCAPVPVGKCSCTCHHASRTNAQPQIVNPREGFWSPSRNSSRNWSRNQTPKLKLSPGLFLRALFFAPAGRNPRKILAQGL